MNDDAEKQARELVNKWLSRGDNYPPPLVDTIAEALRRERAECKKADLRSALGHILVDFQGKVRRCETVQPALIDACITRILALLGEK